MTDDPFSHHRTGAAGTFVYNRRLHLYDTRTTFFNGFPPAFFSWISGYNGTLRPDDPDSPYNSFTVEVELGLPENNGKPCRYAYDRTPLFYSAMLSYPDARAKRITFGAIDPHDGRRRLLAAFDLRPHTALNLAYYLHDGLMPVVIAGENPGDLLPPADTAQAVTVRERNRLKVSETDNPFLFPNANTVYVSDGQILALATNAMNVSDQNYGMHPLFVFTDKGVWTLNTGGGETAYTALAVPTTQEVPASPVVCGTPYGVVFISQRGLVMVNGGAARFISPQLEQPPVPLIPNYTPAELPFVTGVLHEPPERPFREFARDVRHMIYNPHEAELILSDGSAYGYVFAFAGESFYRTTERLDGCVKNAWPQLYSLKNGDGECILKDFGQAADGKAHVSLMLRPLRFGIPDTKKLDRMILRGLLYGLDGPAEGKKPLLAVCHSIDGQAFFMTRGRTFNPGSYKDADMGLLARSKFPCFTFALGGLLDESSRIYLLEAMIIREYANEKMR
jgi:hypothetical protein